MLGEKTNGKCGVAQDLVFFIFKGTIEEVEKVIGIRRDGPFHAINNFCYATNSSGTIVQRTVLLLNG